MALFAHRWSFAFERVAPAGFLDQNLTIDLSGRKVIAPILRFTPVDATGAPVDGVSVASVYGSDRVGSPPTRARTSTCSPSTARPPIGSPTSGSTSPRNTVSTSARTPNPS